MSNRRGGAKSVWKAVGGARSVWKAGGGARSVWKAGVGPFSTAGMPAQSDPGGKPISVNQSSKQPAGPGEDSSGDVDHHGPKDHPASSRGGEEALLFREDKQETGVVRPYPQVPVQTHSQSPVPALSQQVPNKAGTPGQPVTVFNPPVQLLQAQPAALVDGQIKAALKSLVPSRLIAPAPASSQGQGGHIPLPLPPKVQPALLGHITVTLESHIAPTSSIPVATISGQQGHSSNRHHLVPANIQIIRSPSVPQHTFASHLPRGAMAAAVMSSCKGPAVLRPASGASAGPVQHTVHHVNHQSIQSRSPVTSSTAVVPISATRNQSPVINPTFTQSAEVLHGHPGLTIHPPPATNSIQRPQGARDTATRITLPSHPAIGGQKPQPLHTMTQKLIFCSGTPVAAATVAPILTTTTTGPGTTTTGPGTTTTGPGTTTTGPGTTTTGPGTTTTGPGTTTTGPGTTTTGPGTTTTDPGTTTTGPGTTTTGPGTTTTGPGTTTTGPGTTTTGPGTTTTGPGTTTTGPGTTTTGPGTTTTGPGTTTTGPGTTTTGPGTTTTGPGTTTTGPGTTTTGPGTTTTGPGTTTTGPGTTTTGPGTTTTGPGTTTTGPGTTTTGPGTTTTGPGTTTTGTAPHTQMTSSTIVTMTMPTHSSHATALTTSTIPVAKVVPQPMAHTSPRVQSDYLGERTNLIQPIAHTSPHVQSDYQPIAHTSPRVQSDYQPIAHTSPRVQSDYQPIAHTSPRVQSDYQPIAHTSPRVQSDYPVERTNLISISGNRSSPNPVTVEARSDNRPPVPVHFQYFLPAFSSSPYPRTHTYTPITSSVSTIRQYPVTPQTPSSALPSQPAMAVATTVHLNPMQLMAVDRIGLQSAQISTQGIQPQPIGAQGIQPAPMGVQGLHSSGPIGAQGIQQAPIAGQQPEAKPSGMVLADGSTFVAAPMGSPFGAAQPVATMVQTHPQGGVGGGGPTLVSSPRPSILRKKPANEGCGVGKNLIPAGPGEANSSRVEGGVRGAGPPRPAGVKPKAEGHMTLVAPPVLVMAAVESLPSQGGVEQQAVSSPAQQHLSQAIPSNLLAPRGPPPPSQPSSNTHLSALSAAMAVTPPGPASMANTVASPTQPAASSTAACSGGSAHTEVKIKQEAESMEMYQPVPQPSTNSDLITQPRQAGSLHGTPSSGDLVPGASPRKKPRKQQHVISTEETEMLETNSTDEDRAMGHRPLGSRAKRRESPPREYVDEEGVRYVPVRPRPPVTLLRHYRNPWKAAYHHFQRYSDIRIKEEEESLQEVANQRGVARRAQGWKMHLCVAQLRQLSNLEHDVYSRLTSLQEGLIPKKRAGVDDELHRINELIQGNIQRCKLVMDQVTEARDTMMKVLDHKDKVLKLLNQNGAVKKSNRLKRKDRA